MSTGIKHDQNKPDMDLIPHEPLVQVARVLGAGAVKYGRHNWRGGLEWSRCIGAALRHIGAFNGGQDLDPETQISHVAHATANLLFLLDYINTHPELDNRYKKPEDDQKAITMADINRYYGGSGAV